MWLFRRIFKRENVSVNNIHFSLRNFVLIFNSKVLYTIKIIIKFIEKMLKSEFILFSF